MQVVPGSPRRSHFPRSAQHLGRQGEELPIVRALPRRARGAEPAAALPALHGEAGGRPLVPPPPRGSRVALPAESGSGSRAGAASGTERPERQRDKLLRAARVRRAAAAAAGTEPRPRDPLEGARGTCTAAVHGRVGAAERTRNESEGFLPGRCGRAGKRVSASPLPEALPPCRQRRDGGRSPRNHLRVVFQLQPEERESKTNKHKEAKEKKAEPPRSPHFGSGLRSARPRVRRSAAARCPRCAPSAGALPREGELSRRRLRGARSRSP